MKCLHSFVVLFLVYVPLTLAATVDHDYSLVVSNGNASPDGGPSRTAVLINGNLGGPVIIVPQNDVLRVKLENTMEEYSDYFGGTSVHWHGFSMRGIPWLDGTSGIAQCPVQKDGSMVYEFEVNEYPGMYFYHDHKSVLQADGLVGALIVTGEADDAVRLKYNVTDDAVILLSEWFDGTAPELAKGLNRPFPTAANETGPEYFTWVGTPRSLLMNFQGCYQDCKMVGNSTNQECVPDAACESRFVMRVQPDGVYRVRLVGAGSLLYQIVCFEGHNVTLVAVDSRPVDPLEIGECVNVNLGNRVDVVLRAKSPSDLKNQTSFWITGRATGRVGMPASYGVLQYSDSDGGNMTLPPTAPPQPGDVPPSWAQTGFWMNITSPRGVVPDYIDRNQTLDKIVLLEVTQPIMDQTKQLRWALSNVVYLQTPSCNTTLALTKDPDWLSDSNPNVITNSSAIDMVNVNDIPGLGQSFGGGESLVFVNMVLDRAIIPDNPLAGSAIIATKNSEIIDVIVQNNNPEALGGVSANRTGQEEHPFHLHGQHFYVIGSGPGRIDSGEALYNGSLDQYLNWKNPRHGDTATLPQDGWVLLRFNADNPGVWPMHCHIGWHEFMGQSMHFAVDVENIPPTPEGVLPECKAECFYTAALYANEAPPASSTWSLYGTGFGNSLTLILLVILSSHCMSQ